jgi:hypothetical protein
VTQGGGRAGLYLIVKTSFGCTVFDRQVSGVGAYFNLMGTNERLLYKDHVRCMARDHARIEREKRVTC